jgi:predicted AAA+ superfamily ATPase
MSEETDRILALRKNRRVGSFRFWSDEEIEILRKYYGQIPTNDLARVLNRTPEAVRAQASRFGIRFPEQRPDYEALKQILNMRKRKKPLPIEAAKVIEG